MTNGTSAFFSTITDGYASTMLLLPALPHIFIASLNNTIFINIETGKRILSETQIHRYCAQGISFPRFFFHEQEQYLKAGTKFLTLHNTMRNGEGKIFTFQIKHCYEKDDFKIFIRNRCVHG